MTNFEILYHNIQFLYLTELLKYYKLLNVYSVLLEKNVFAQK